MGQFGWVGGLKKCLGPNIHQAKFHVFSFLVVGDLKKEVAQNVLKLALVLEFLKSNEIFLVKKSNAMKVYRQRLQTNTGVTR